MLRSLFVANFSTLLFLISTTIMVFAYIILLCERPYPKADELTEFPSCLWLTLITMTTVGYSPNAHTETWPRSVPQGHLAHNKQRPPRSTVGYSLRKNPYTPNPESSEPDTRILATRDPIPKTSEPPQSSPRASGSRSSP